MDYLREFIVTVFSLFCEGAPFLLVGFFLAGLIKVLIPQDRIYGLFGKNNLKSVLRAALFGVPLPLCSCSVLPAAAALKDRGASKGATTAFLISTPETGVDSIGFTYALMDPLMTIFRPLAAVVTAVVTGSMVNVIARRSPKKSRGQGEADAVTEAGAIASRRSTETTLPPREEKPPGVGDAPREGRRGVWRVLTEAHRYASGHLLDDLVRWFLLGFLVSGVIAVVVPEDFFGETIPSGWASAVVMLLVATPMYVCATSATPIAVVLIAKGLDPGAALVFLLVGPATNITTMLVVRRFMGRSILLVYILCVTGMALFFGLWVNAIYGEEGMTLASTAGEVLTAGPSWFQLLAAGVFAVYLQRSIARTRLLASWGGSLRRACRPLGFDPFTARSGLVATVGLLALWLTSAFSIVGPGEVGWVERFGKVVRILPGSGLQMHWPSPIDRVTRLRRDEVRGMTFGFLRADPTLREIEGPGPGGDLVAQAEVMSGEESILRITYAVHYSVGLEEGNAFAFHYRLENPANLIEVFAECALRRSVAHRTTSMILVTDREELEGEMQQILQKELDAIRSGIRVEGVTLRDVHAPESVHFAYRDVASALEDKSRFGRLAEGFEVEVIAAARASAYVSLREAESYRSQEVLRATGASLAFGKRLEAYREDPRITRMRLFFSAAEEALSAARIICLLGEGVRVELWSTERRSSPEEADQKSRSPNITPPPEDYRSFLELLAPALRDR
jgi:HflK protein